MLSIVRNVYERPTILNQLSALRNFYTVKMNQGEKFLSYLNHVKQLAAVLQSMAVQIEDNAIPMAAINGLPSIYEHLIIALDAIRNNDLHFSVDLVKATFF